MSAIPFPPSPVERIARPNKAEIVESRVGTEGQYKTREAYFDHLWANLQADEWLDELLTKVFGGSRHYTNRRYI